MSRDRDPILEQALKHELRADPGPVTPECLDAETFAAWEDGALDAKQMEAAELHVSTCAHCQAMVGAMARGGQTTAAVVEPKQFRLWSWWLAPIAAATAAVVMWAVVPQQRQIATALPAPPAVSSPAVIEPKPPASTTAPAEPFLPPDAPALGAKDKVKPRANVADQTVAKSASADAIAAPPPAPVVAPSPSPPPPPAAPPALMQERANLAFAPIEIASPNSTRRWRIVSGGIEFSTDAGASWMPVRAVPTESLTGGVSPSGTIAWFIGKAGLVLVTADGSIFARVDLPVRVDVTSIAATDARSATVTIADGRAFRTDDSGRTWRQN
jgi:hypothetical protein